MIRKAAPDSRRLMRGVQHALSLALLSMAVAGCGQAASSPPAAGSSGSASPSTAAPAASSGAANSGPSASAAATPRPPASGQAAASGAATAKVKVGTVGLGPEVPVFLAEDKGYFREVGVEVDYANVRNSSEAIPLLATGQLDFAPAGVDPSLFNAAQRDTGVKMLASEAVANKEGPAGAALVVAQSLVDSGQYTGVKDLKGKNIGLNSPGAVGQMITEEILATGGLKGSDVNYVQLSFPDMAAAVANKKIDAAYLTEPFISIGVSKGLYKVAMLAGDVHPGLIGLVILGGANLKAQQDATTRFMVAYLRGLRFYYEAYFANPTPSGKDEVIRSITKHTPNKDPQVVAAMGMTGVDPNGAVDEKDLQRFQDYFLKAGTQKTSIELSQLVDTSFLNAALQRLGPYKR